MTSADKHMLNKTVKSVYLTEDKEAIKFVFDDNSDVIVKCDADCCSHTWIESVDLPSGGFPFKVLETKDLDLSSRDSDDGENKFYGFALKTDKGDFVIDYRNASNGYYGGNLSWPDERHYGGVFGQNNSDCNKWIDLTEEKKC